MQACRDFFFKIQTLEGKVLFGILGRYKASKIGKCTLPYFARTIKTCVFYFQIEAVGAFIIIFLFLCNTLPGITNVLQFIDKVFIYSILIPENDKNPNT